MINLCSGISSGEPAALLYLERACILHLPAEASPKTRTVQLFQRFISLMNERAEHQSPISPRRPFILQGKKSAKIKKCLLYLDIKTKQLWSKNKYEAHTYTAVMPSWGEPSSAPLQNWSEWALYSQTRWLSQCLVRRPFDSVLRRAQLVWPYTR